jgi:hypothetical protein
MRRKYSSPHWLLRTLAFATAVSFGCLLFGALWLINLSPTLAADPTVPANAADDDNQKKSGPALLAYIAYKS